ncbi:P-loop containing nucleoside triphosphate hydrolase protein [Aspergillus campestris IBT 28561]|uniref:P-loop containing nucleoside triphosphate hydrolase protein n=1 Tax=Aspergillus campestris (strain IBT 28561) TaxID=1392248 RepID=A0A2I1CZJ8_ASPC2|nr:P-loop containing nucleoside triphosphate hydrolase protein [Aspergillus campestris IBT 28561]PKY03050.1 P-loop containing nucleoside triphosphate hydrolase protein [Aspergillus campestris IBT 28561]
MIDGRLFFEVLSTLEHMNVEDILSPSASAKFDMIMNLLGDQCGINLIQDGKPRQANETRQSVVPNTGHQPVLVSVLPFSNPVLDPHLKDISLAADNHNEEKDPGAVSQVFREISHWHNHKRLLNTNGMKDMTDWQRTRAIRRNQRFMIEMRDYAKSLTGGHLEPQVIAGVPSKQQHKLNHSKPTSTAKAAGNERTHEQNHKRHGRSKPGPSTREQIAAAQKAEAARKSVHKHMAQWKYKSSEFQQKESLMERYLEARKFLNGLDSSKRQVLEAEVLTYTVATLLEIWARRCSSHRRNDSTHIVALIWNAILRIAKLKKGVTEEIAKSIRKTIESLKLPVIDIASQGNEKLSFRFPSLSDMGGNLAIELSPVEFQLMHAGPYFDRSMGSRVDPRVPDFEPDEWQRKILDLIDARKSLFVVAPTSAGKTFISFYAMKQVLEDSEDGILVYVAPTKALVNQIAAEIMARFSKSYKTPGKSVWAIHTRDYRINNPVGCQVLITVPHILQIMLLAPAHADSWSSRIKRIIFDEVHCIGQADDGVVWEQLLLLAPCPIIALSATVGNPKEFNNWLSLTQESNGHELELVEHKARWSDLRKFEFHPPHSFSFNGFSKSNGLNALGLDASTHMAFLHPVASLIDKSRGIPDDLTLEPRDGLSLWKAMNKYQTVEFPLDLSLDPAESLPNVVSKADIIKWETKLKAVLKQWMAKSGSPFDAVLNELSSQVPLARASNDNTQKPGLSREVKQGSILSTTLPLICALHDQGALPALIFNYDRRKCEQICETIIGELQQAEDNWKSTSTAWAEKVTKWEAWKESQQKLAKAKSPTKTKKRSSDNDENMSKDEQAREEASTESSPFASFDPEAPLARFSLADERKLLYSEFEVLAEELKGRLVPSWLIDALRRGVGVHHAGMNRKYRQVCEMLFRKGYLRVVIATGTLALGINMPCKTVVFAGDSVFLTALGFRQAAGRAGRRGFDVLGNVVFQNVSHAKVCRLLSSKLPDLNGHFPITTSLVLRLFILLHQSKQAPFAVKAINSILSCPRIYLGGPESKHTVLHHLRFSIEYLRRNHLLDEAGAPLNFAGTICHLYYTENSSFAFHALLSGGYFHRLCKDVHKNPERVLRILMLVMANLFGRRHIRPSILEAQRAVMVDSPSIVFLPALPTDAAEILQAHNKKTLDIYSAYVTTFVDQHITEPDCILPLSHVKVGGDKSAEELSPSLALLPPTKVNSAFVALSGHRDYWNSIPDLCKKVRSGVWLEQNVVPHVGITDDGMGPLNAYLYDFFRHGDVHALETANMIRKGDIWFVLNDFSLVLATIATALENFFKQSPDTDDFQSATGSGEAYENELEDELMKDGPNPEMPKQGDRSRVSGCDKTSASFSVSSVKPKKNKAKVADSWEDEVDDSSTEKEEYSKDPISSIEEDNTGEDFRPQEGGLREVLVAFRMLQSEFNVKFRAMFA